MMRRHSDISSLDSDRGGFCRSRKLSGSFGHFADFVRGDEGRVDSVV